MARDGVVAQDQKDLLKLNHHPSAPSKKLRDISLDVARPVAEPPISPRTPPACVSPGFTNPRWLATLRSPGANFHHASGVQTSSPKGGATLHKRTP